MYVAFVEAAASATGDALERNLDAIANDPVPPDAWVEYVANATERLFILAALLGMDHARRDMGLAEDEPALFADFEIDEEPIPFDEAIAALRERIAMSPEEFAELEAALRYRAFATSLLSGYDAAARVQAILTSSLERGETMREAIERIGADDVVRRAGFSSSSPWYWETVYRTNVTAAYNTGRWAQYRREEGAIYAIEFIGIEDDRQTDICRAYDGIVRPVDDAIWGQITPPNHFACRSTLRAILADTAEARRVRLTRPDREIPQPQAGFEAAATSIGDLAVLPDAVLERVADYGLTDRLRARATELGI